MQLVKFSFLILFYLDKLSQYCVYCCVLIGAVNTTAVKRATLAMFFIKFHFFAKVTFMDSPQPDSKRKVFNRQGNKSPDAKLVGIITLFTS